MLSFSSFIFYRILFWVRYNFLSVFISPLLHLFSISFFWRHFLLSNNIFIFPIIFPFLHIIQKLQNFFLSASFLSLQFTKPSPLNFSFLISPFHLPFPPPTILLSLFSITRNLFLSLPLLPTKLTPHVHILLSQTRFFIGASLLTLPLEHPPHPSSPQDARRRRRGWEGRGAERTGAVLLHALFHAHFSASICAAARGMGPLSGRGYPLRHVTGAYIRVRYTGWKLLRVNLDRFG